MALCMHWVTSLINMGLNFKSNKFRKELCRRNNFNHYDKAIYKENEAYLKSLGYKANKTDFILFSQYLTDRNKAARIIPSYIINQWATPLLNPIAYRGFFEDKNSFDRIFQAGICPETILRRMNGKWYDKDYRPLETPTFQDIVSLLNSYPDFIIKPTIDSSSGKGIDIFTKENNEFVSKSDRKPFSLELIGEKWRNSDLIIQKVLRQSEYLSRFNETSVNTLRIAMYNSPVDNRPHLLWSIIRIGGKGSFVDNAHSGGVFVGIDKDGKLNDYASDTYGAIIREHNGISFSENHQIPNFHDIIQFVKELTPRLYPNRLIAFDIMIDDQNKPRLIEYNIRAFSDWLGYFSGFSSLSDYAEEILSYCKENKSHNQKAIFYLS